MQGLDSKSPVVSNIFRKKGVLSGETVFLMLVIKFDSCNQKRNCGHCFYPRCPDFHLAIHNAPTQREADRLEIGLIEKRVTEDAN